MRKLARGGGNSAIAARELHLWAHEAMQMGALADGGKGKRKTSLQGPEYQGLADNTADCSRDKRGSWRRGVQQAECPANASAA